jgi:hypothetical protein
MKNLRKNLGKKNAESGVALLIALIALLLISGVAVAMIVASGSEGALNGNYRSSSSVYYAALAGLEEGRGRLLPTSPTTIVGVANTGIPAFGTTMTVNQVSYILNPNTAAGEAKGSIMTTYPDTEYDNSEFGSGKLAAATKFYVDSTAGTNSSNIPGPMYKWVRINPVTEYALKMDVDNNGVLDQANVLYYETANTPPSLTQTLSSTAYQVLEVTGLAVLPNGTQKLMQYLVTPQVYGLDFSSAVTLAGTVGNFAGANSNPFKMNGQDGSGSPPAVPNCTPNAGTVKNAIGVTSAADASVVTAGIPSNRQANYTGLGGGTPNVGTPALTSTLSTTASLDRLITNVRGNADVVIPNPPNPPNYNNSATTYNFGQSGPGYTWPAGMSASNPKTIYVDGSFDLGPNTGYGLLVVTGNFHYHGNSGWKGIILVVGNGTTTFDGLGGGNGEFDGAIFVATTRDVNGVMLPNFGPVNYNISGGGGNGVYYNSCWIKQVQQPPTYKVLSFREIQYTAN